MATFANLPPAIEEAIYQVLLTDEHAEWVYHAAALHERYTTRKKGSHRSYIEDERDVFAYLAMRAPATYAQIFSVLSSVKEIIPSWQPASMIDIGAGPGVGMWAASELFSSVSSYTNLDKESLFLQAGQTIQSFAHLIPHVEWRKHNLVQTLNTHTKYDIVVLSNVLNELSDEQKEKTLARAYELSKGVVIVIEPGTPYGMDITEKVADEYASKSILLAPYIANSFVPKGHRWLHFSQRFQRPQFQRRIRQHLRTASHMASDWEETKFAYTVLSTVSPEIDIYARVIGPVEKQKGFLEIPLLTAEKFTKVKVLKRNKNKYNQAKNLQWGDIILHHEQQMLT